MICHLGSCNLRDGLEVVLLRLFLRVLAVQAATAYGILREHVASFGAYLLLDLQAARPKRLWRLATYLRYRSFDVTFRPGLIFFSKSGMVKIPTRTLRRKDPFPGQYP